MTTRTQCTAITKGGERCRHRNNLSPEFLCLHHDPERKRQVQAMRKKGGKAAAKKKLEGRIKTVSRDEVPDLPETLADIAGWLGWLAQCGPDGTLDSRTIETTVKVLVALRGVIEKTSLAEEIEALRTQLAELRRGSMGVR